MMTAPRPSCSTRRLAKQLPMLAGELLTEAFETVAMGQMRLSRQRGHGVQASAAWSMGRNWI